MSKELTLTDKLRLLRFGKVDKQYLENQYYDEIEKELETREQYVQIAEKEHEDYMALCEEITRLKNKCKKQEKVLEIIKEKRVNIKGLLKCIEDYDDKFIQLQEYNECFAYKSLIQEEYNLLGEVLL